MPRIEAWWVCSYCKKPIKRVGKGTDPTVWDEHRKVCHPLAGGGIKQIPQKTKPKQRSKK